MLRDYAEDNNNYNYNKNKSKSCLQSIVSYSTKELSASNSKSTHLQSASIVAIAIRSKQFRLFDVEYFYSELLEKFYSTDNYIISRKNVFYCDIYIFMQQIRRVTITKDVNNQLYFCLRKSAII